MWSNSQMDGRMIPYYIGNWRLKVCKDQGLEMATTKCSISMPIATKTYTVGYKNTHNMRRNSCHIPVSGCTAEQDLHMHILHLNIVLFFWHLTHICIFITPIYLTRIMTSKHLPSTNTHPTLIYIKHHWFEYDPCHYNPRSSCSDKGYCMCHCQSIHVNQSGLKSSPKWKLEWSEPLAHSLLLVAKTWGSLPDSGGFGCWKSPLGLAMEQWCMCCFMSQETCPKTMQT
jgi:hypothetical protein